MDVSFAPSHDEVLQLVVQLALLLGCARLLGELARRLGQPAVVGEILAGVILGPSVIGAIVPRVADVWLPATSSQARLLETMALLGAMLLLVVTGLETDLSLIRRKAGSAAGVALGGLVLPFAGGLALGWWFPLDLIGDPDLRLVFALFLATAMAVSAIPVLAAILLELGLMRRDIGQTMLAAGMVDDLAGWAVLGVVIALAEGGGGVAALWATIATVALFLAATALAGPLIVRWTLRFVHGLSSNPSRFLTAALVLAFGWSAFSQSLHLEPVIGAFAMGILLGRVRSLPTSVAESLESMTFGVFAPIFFAVAGLKVDIVALAETRLMVLTVAVVAVAVVGKMVGVYAGARLLARADHWTSLSFGVGLTARGAIGIVVATIGSSLGILTPEVFSMVVVMAVVTSLITPLALEFTLRRVTQSDEETMRMQRERATAGSLVGRIGRVLVPMRPRLSPGDGVDVKTTLIGLLSGGRRISATVMSVAGSHQDRREAETTVRLVARQMVSDVEVTTRVVGGHPVTAVLGETAKGYDLVVIGATEVSIDPDALFGSTVDEIVRMAPTPTLVVRGASVPGNWRPQRILLPTDGTPASQRATDLALSFAGPGTTVTALHVVPAALSPVVSVTDTGPVHRLDLAHQIVSDVRSQGEAIGVDVATMVEMSTDLDAAILSAAADMEADLIVLGTSARAGTHRLYLGPRVERVLAHSTCSVAVLNS